jgi:integrase
VSFLVDVQELKTGLVIFRRADVKHRNWYCRVKVPKENRYKTISLKTSDINQARDMAFDHDADIRFRVKHEVPIFEKSFAEVATEYSEFHKGVATSGQITMNRWKIVDSYIRLHLVPYMGNHYCPVKLSD